MFVTTHHEKLITNGNCERLHDQKRRDDEIEDLRSFTRWTRC